MIASEDRAKIAGISRKYQVKRVLLFGSSLTGDGNDIDLAVEGVSPRRFYELYAELMLALSKPVDLIDLSVSSKFVEMVRQEGVPVYG